MSENIVKLASLHELSINKLMRVKQEQSSICMAYVESNVYAIDGMCTPPGRFTG